MSVDVWLLWNVSLLPLLFFGLVLPALLSGGFHPGRVKQKIIELCLPIGALGAWVGCVSALQNLSDPSMVRPIFYTILSQMLIWVAIYGFAYWFPIKSLKTPHPRARKSIQPVLAVLCFIGGWWATVGVSSSHARSFIDWQAAGIFGVSIFLVFLWSRQQGHPVTVGYFAKASLRIGYLCLAASLFVLVGNMDDPSKLGPALAQGITASVYGLILHQILILLEPLSEQSKEPPRKPGHGMLLGYAVHAILMSVQWGLVMLWPDCYSA